MHTIQQWYYFIFLPCVKILVYVCTIIDAIYSKKKNKLTVKEIMYVHTSEYARSKI